MHLFCSSVAGKIICIFQFKCFYIYMTVFHLFFYFFVFIFCTIKIVLQNQKIPWLSCFLQKKMPSPSRWHLPSYLSHQSMHSICLLRLSVCFFVLYTRFPLRLGCIYRQNQTTDCRRRVNDVSSRSSCQQSNGFIIFHR